MADRPNPPSNDQFRVGWICALPTEMAAAEAMLDQQFNSLVQDKSDHNSYAYGRIGHINVVIACLPAGLADTVTAATVASTMLRSFQSVKIGLMVGVGGGVPTPQKDIQLGDVVVSKPAGLSGGVVQYDRGKRTAGGVFEKTGTLNKPPDVLLNALNKLRAEFERHAPQVEELLTETLRKTSPWMLNTYCRPDAVDKLYRPDYDHPGHSGDCTTCDPQKLVRRSQRTELKIHSGTIASGNSVIKDAAERDNISKDLGGILCFETEAAGLMDGFPCLVIRGICDYADSHKNKQWQRFAAATAAAYAKMLVAIMPPSEVEKAQAAQQIVSHNDHPLSGTSTPLGQRSLPPSGRNSTFQQRLCPPLSASSLPLLQSSLPTSASNPTFQQGPSPSEKFRREDFGQKFGGLERKPLPRESVGYKQPARIYRPQRPTKSYSDQSGQPTQYHYSLSIPLHPLPGLESKPIGRTTPRETPLGLAADYYFGPQDMDGDSQHENTKIRGNHSNDTYHSEKNSSNHGNNQYYSDKNSGNHNGLKWGNQHIDGHNQYHSNKISGHHNEPKSGHHTGYEEEADHDDDVNNFFISGTGSYSGQHDEGEDENVNNSPIPRSGPYSGYHDKSEDKDLHKSPTPRAGSYGSHDDESDDGTDDESDDGTDVDK